MIRVLVSLYVTGILDSFVIVQLHATVCVLELLHVKLFEMPLCDTSIVALYFTLIKYRPI